MDRVDEFLFRGFIPEENRAGTYHVTLLLSDKLVGPMTPEQAEAKGWGLPQICADINLQMLAELNSLKADKEALQTELSQSKASNSALTKQVEQLTLHASVLQDNLNAVTQTASVKGAK